MFTRSIVAACLLAATSPNASAAEAPAPALPSPGPAPDWRLVGGAYWPTLVQPLGAGRALVCNQRRCDVWDRTTGAWTPTDGVVLPLDTSYLRRQDGAVVAIDGARTIASEIWSPVTGHWTAAAALPERLDHLRTAQVADGRLIAVGDWHGRTRAYIADPALRSWSHLIDSPEGLVHPGAFPTASGVLLFGGRHRVWRHTLGTEGWQEIPVALLLSGKFPAVRPWQDQVLITSQDPEAVVVDRDGKGHPAAVVPSETGFNLQPITTADGMEMRLVLGNARWLWRRPDEAPIPLPENTIEPPYLIVALDDDHLLGVGDSGAVTTLALDGKASPGQPCDGLGRYLAQTPPPTPVVSELQLVNAGCREQVRRGEANELLTLTRSWAGREDRLDYGRAFECALQDPSALKVLPGWLDKREGHSRTVCYQSLASWPGAEKVWKPALESAVFKLHGHWNVDSAVTALAVAVPTTEVLERLVPTLRTAAERQANGFDALNKQVCRPDPTASVARQRTCAELASQHEAEWERKKAEAHTRPSSQVPGVLAATAVYAGAVAAAYATRNNDGGRGIAIGAGALGGAALGLTAGAAAVLLTYGFGPGGGHGEESWILVGSLAGSILGGIAAYAATESPSSRAPATAVGLALPYVFTLFFVLE